MDNDPEKLISTFATLFIRNNENFDFLEAKKFYRTKEWEYEKRIVSSLLVGSGAGVSLILTFLSSAERSSYVTAYSVLSISLFVLALIITGLAQIILNEAASKYVSFYSSMNNIQNYQTAIHKVEKLTKLNETICEVFPSLKFSDESARDTKFELNDKKFKLKQAALEYEGEAIRLQNTASSFLKIACILFFIGVFIGIGFVLGEYYDH